MSWSAAFESRVLAAKIDGRRPALVAEEQNPAYSTVANYPASRGFRGTPPFLYQAVGQPGDFENLLDRWCDIHNLKSIFRRFGGLDAEAQKA